MDKDPIILASRRRAGKANKGKPKPKDFKGSWERHPRKSWGEQIAAELLVKNNVPFQDEKQVGKYWLDFFIEIKGIKYDVEIDGVQHTREEFIEHDRERDIFIKSRGYTVYRFPWSKNNIQIFRESFEHFINASFV
jgi:very-short-patch-repair endonuclease